ncbi:MAG: porin [Flavobacterium sp.]|nr:porin [Flavobacterium sp.]
MKNVYILLILLIGASASAQIINVPSSEDNDPRLSSLPYYSYGKGLGLTSPDSLFQFNIRFRMQNRVTYLDAEDEKPSYDGQIRRLRLRFDGFIGSPKLLYAIQLSFAPGDVGELEDGGNINIIRDAVIFYRPNDHWDISFGQTKLPGNRQRVNSSGALQLTDRTINNARFTIDRDFGFQVHHSNEDSERFSYDLKAALSTGEGRNVTGRSDDGVAVTAKAELFPLGAFTRDGSYFEGDLVRETKPKLMLSGGYHQNNQALRTQGTLGDFLFQPRTMRSVFVDAMFKYNGWSAMSAYLSRTTSKNAITYNDDLTDFNFVQTGSGFDYQLGYLFPTNYEIIGRFSTQKAGDDIIEFVPDAKQYSLGVTKYIWEHTFKLQAEVTLDELNYFDGNKRNNWYVRFQVEIGI